MTDFIFRGVTPDGKVVEGWYRNTNGCVIKDEKTWSDFDILPLSLALSAGIPDKHGRMIFGSVPVNGEMSKGGDVLRSYDNYGKGKEIIGEVKYSTVIGSFLAWVGNQSYHLGEGDINNSEQSQYTEIIGSQWEEKG
jgi:hypothetical protein